MDISLINSIINNQSSFDIDYEADGDFVQDDLDTSIYIGYLANARADESEVSVAEYRQGSWIKTIDDIETGSKIWLQDGRKTPANLGRILDYAEKGSQFLLDENLVKKVEEDAVFIENGIVLNTEITKLDNSPLTKNYIL